MFNGYGIFSLLALLASACVSTRMNDNGAGGGGAYFFGDGDAAVDASGTALVGGMTPLTPSLRSQLENAACATWTSEAGSQPVILDFVVDTSSSMINTTPSSGNRTKWEVTRDSLLSAINRLPQTTQVGMLLFPNRSTVPNQNTTPIDVTNCLNTAEVISINRLDLTGSGQRQSIANGLQKVTPQGARPTIDAFNYALANGMIQAASAGAGSPYMVLITDGRPTLATGCEGLGDETHPVDYQPIIDAISGAWSNHGIKTYVLGLPGSEKDAATGSDVRYWLSRAASAGQTQVTNDCSDTGIPNFCHCDMSQVPDFASSFQRALQSIVAPALSCTYAIRPSAAGASVDPASINLIYDVLGDQSQELLIGQADVNCTSGDGWYLDSANNIVLCANTCTTIQQNPTAALRILGGCSSLIIIS